MKYLLIKNEGLIEVAALHLMGASSKRRDETKIGMFGTGNKYALSYLFRNDYRIRIFSGNEEIKIELKSQKFRDQSFDVIYINGQQTSLTTEMGPNWNLWKAIRELYCNAIDEGNSLLYVVDTIKSVSNETHVYIEITLELDEFLKNYDEYFSFKKEVLYSSSDGEILRRTGSGGNIYRKGIRCLEKDTNSIFDYNFFSLDVNEERLVIHYWSLYQKLWDTILGCNVPSLIKEFFKSLSEKMFEYNALYLVSFHTPSQEVIDYLDTQRIVPDKYAGWLEQEDLLKCLILPSDLFFHLEKYVNPSCIPSQFNTTKNGQLFKIIEPNSLHTTTVKKAMDFFKEAKIDIPYEILYAEFQDKNWFGLALNNKIHLSTLGLERGVQETVNTIMEEYVHLKYNVKDCTRQFQTASINEFINYLKKEHSYIL